MTYYAPYVFYPYYTAFFVAALYHGLNGVYGALMTVGLRIPARLRDGWPFWAPVALGSALGVAGILGIGGWLYPIADPRDVLATRFAEPLRWVARFMGTAP